MVVVTVVLINIVEYIISGHYLVAASAVIPYNESRTRTDGRTDGRTDRQLLSPAYAVTPIQ